MAIATLESQHRTVLARLAQVEGAGESAPLNDFLGFLEGEVREHFELEEEVLFPVLEQHRHLAQGPVAVMRTEHEEFRALLAGLGDALRSGSAAAAGSVVRQIIDLLRAHIDKEDHVLFPIARSVLGADELAALDARVGVVRS